MFGAQTTFVISSKPLIIFVGERSQLTLVVATHVVNKVNRFENSLFEIVELDGVYIVVYVAEDGV